jgi:hypothetical protein
MARPRWKYARACEFKVSAVELVNEQGYSVPAGGQGPPGGGPRVRVRQWVAKFPAEAGLAPSGDGGRGGAGGTAAAAAAAAAFFAKERMWGSPSSTKGTWRRGVPGRRGLRRAGRQPLASGSHAWRDRPPGRARAVWREERVAKVPGRCTSRTGGSTRRPEGAPGAGGRGRAGCARTRRPRPCGSRRVRAKGRRRFVPRAHHRPTASTPARRRTACWAGDSAAGDSAAGDSAAGGRAGGGRRASPTSPTSPTSPPARGGCTRPGGGGGGGGRPAQPRGRRLVDGRPHAGGRTRVGDGPGGAGAGPPLAAAPPGGGRCTTATAGASTRERRDYQHPLQSDGITCSMSGRGARRLLGQRGAMGSFWGRAQVRAGPPRAVRDAGAGQGVDLRVRRGVLQPEAATQFDTVR